jgi:hypothetical protein
MQSDERVELHLAACGLDLWSLIESAQYARIVLHESPIDEGEAQAMADFVETLSGVIEAWSEIGQNNAAPMLKHFDTRLADLACGGLFVHGGCVERSVATKRLPLAIIRIGHTRDKRVTVAIPTELEIALPEGHEDTEDT